MRYIYLILLAMLFVGCEKDPKKVQYIAEINFDDSAADHSVIWEDHSGYTPISISESPRSISVFVPEGEELHVTATYRNGITKSVEVKIRLNGNLVASEVGYGAVDVKYQP